MITKEMVGFVIFVEVQEIMVVNDGCVKIA